MEIDFDSLETREIDLATSSAHPETAQILSELDRKKLARKIALPTNDGEVRARLRELDQPVTLFGEGPADRRDRLRDLLAQARMSKMGSGANGDGIEIEGADDQGSDEDGDDDDADDDDDQDEEFYTEGSIELKKARRDLADYSLPRARKRIARQRTDATVPLARLMDVRKAVFSNLESFTNLGSQIGDTRALSAVRFSPDSKMLLTGSWTGVAKLWNVPSCKEIRTLKGHSERIGGVAWHPDATLTQSPTAVNFATSGADNLIKLWDLETENSIQTLSGHEGRVCRINFHPSGRYLGSASYDATWRLWDVETASELLLQEGHSKEVYAIAFQNDGALVCTGGLDAIARLWDLRSGRTSLVLSGHSRDILSIDFSPNGYQVATGSNDDTIRIWDLRNHKAIATIPGHKSAISDLKFFQAEKLPDLSYPDTKVPRAFEDLEIFKDVSNDHVKKEEEDVEMSLNGATPHANGRNDKPDFPVSGSFLVSSGYDGYVKVWSADDWQQVRSLSNDSSGKVMSCDVSSDARFIVSGQYDRSYKLWATADVDLS
ncbi:U4/U6-U5 snRNP complex subunit PRP4 [Sporobolomyces koalae]|uniref:U4/U6-U5 snRNP complex subunit PRP4 n=1 Tax=Sporobolomyces koalae TaxID=500713 RepID=UPI00317F49C9